MSTVSVLREVRDERRRQDAKFPDQKLRSGHGLRVAWLQEMLRSARYLNDNHGVDHEATWATVLAEEFGEAMTADDLSDLRGELIQVAAVCARWVENIDAGELLA